MVAARERLAARGVDRGLLGDQAHGGLERHLLERLTGLCARALLLELAVLRAARLSPLERLAARTGESRIVYEELSELLRTSGLAELFREYPVLHRLTERVSALWVDAAAEFLGRLGRDRSRMERVFGELGQVVSVEPGLSDPHRGGRAVASLIFASGVKLAYKPKDVGTERAFSRLLSWLNDRGAPLPFRVLTILDRPGYGWVEWLEHEPCSSPEAARRYYGRAGALLCLVYALAGTDCHRDNLIAAGEHPVLVDVECLLHHRPRTDRAPASAGELALDALRGGVLGTGLLPNWQLDGRSGRRRASDISGLHTPDPAELVAELPRWEQLNRDGMALRPGRVALAPSKSQPVLSARPLRLEDHAADVIDGFTRFYDFLVEQRPALLAPSSPIHQLLRQPVRFLYRSTRVYEELHRQLCDPAYLRDETGRRRELERLPGSWSEDRPHDRWLPLIDAEREAMEQMDVPLFTARADVTTLTLAPGRALSGCLREPSADLVRERLRALSADDRETQLGFIAGSLYASSARHEPPTPTAPPRIVARATGDRVALMDAALAIAAEMAARAIRAPTDGGAAWIAPQYLPQLERYQLQPIGHDLHSGTCGIALFLAAVAHVTGHDEHRRLARAALQTLRTALSNGPDAVADSLGLGAASGLGSVVYALARIARFLDEPNLLADAGAAASLLTDDRIIAAPGDVFSGLAGEILALLVLDAEAHDASTIGRATACGRVLLSARTTDSHGPRAWITVGDRMLTGFSHGAAGIAYALLRLHAATGDDAFRSAAAEAIAYEDSLFDEGAGNWPDLRGDAQPAFKRDWCHGAPGIGLARLGGLPMLDTPQVRADIEVALRTTLSVGLAGPDHLCCGNVGRADVLLAAGERLGRAALAEAGREHIEQVTRRAQTAHGVQLNTALPRRVNMPGFFMGMAGIGYEMLRAAHPGRLPCVLLWE